MPRRRQTFDPRTVLAALERNRVDYVLIGGLAQVIRGADLTTRGVDICPAWDSPNLDRVSRAVDALDARDAVGEPVDVTEAVLEAENTLSLTTPSGVLCIIGVPEGAPRGFVDLRRAATKEHLGHGVQPLVASAADLARMAAARGRDHDADRLRQLRRIVELEAGREPVTPPTEPTIRSAGRGATRARRIQP